MNGGTCTTRPVSSVAGFSCALAVAPFIAGAVSVTVRSTVSGRLDADRIVLEHLHGDLRLRQQVVDRISQRLRRQRHLLVRLRIHEIVRVPVRVQELHAARVEGGPLDLILGAELVVGERPATQVAQPALDESVSLARRQVLHIEQAEEVAAHPDQHPLA